jgi:dTDP-glucose 4,6-dehydratase
LERDLGWRAQETFATGIKKTVRCYLENLYRGERLGLQLSEGSIVRLSVRRTR